ncbi:MAG: GNAT family N-acetyltransferase [Actinobacteria bacterium HGW-Actinobacteria-4]|nr:MAG: GNAT family N-acetyltransferase [Actinobacteria bacterium HGW-Actinobacteria-4]
MTMLPGYTAVSVSRDRASEVLDIDSWGFAFTSKESDAPRLEEIFEFSRGRGIELTDTTRGPQGSLVAIHTSIPYPMRVPGGATVPTSGLTWVAVHPGHRRQGLLTQMIDDHFARSLARGEAVSTLYAAEPEIYQRFGYGLACPALGLDLGRKPSFREFPGAKDLRIRLENASLDAHAKDVAAVQRRMMRPGTMVEMSEVSMRDLFMDLENWRDGAERFRIAIVEDAQGPAAFAVFHRKQNWEDFASGTTTVRTWGSATGAATHRLMSVLSDMDLMAKTKVSHLAADDPLVNSLVDLRAVKATMGDNLWVRILDVPAALEARTYAADVDISIEVTDKQIHENHKVWRLQVTDGAAQVTPAERDAPAQLRLSIQELSTAYLGGITIAALAQASLVEELVPGAVSRLSVAMRGDELPVSNISF